MKININIIMLLTFITQVFAVNKVITRHNNHDTFDLDEIEYIGTARIDELFRIYVTNYQNQSGKSSFNVLYCGKALQLLAMHYILGRDTRGLTKDIVYEYINYIDCKGTNSELYQGVADIVSVNDLEDKDMKSLTDITDIRIKYTFGD